MKVLECRIVSDVSDNLSQLQKLNQCLFFQPQSRYYVSSSNPLLCKHYLLLAQVTLLPQSLVKIVPFLFL